MNDEELRSTIEQVKAQVKAKPENKDKSDDEIDEIILDGFFKAYTEGELTKEDLGAIAEAMGYQFTEEFENDEEGAPMQVEPEDEEGGLPATEKELEDAREIGPGEDVEEFKEDIDELNSRKEDGDEDDDEEFDEEETEEDEEEEEDGDEEDEREAASKLWKMDLRK